MTVKSINPETEEVILSFRETTKDEIIPIIKKARQAQKSWQSTNRIELIQKLKTNIIAEKREICRLVKQEAGFLEKETEAVVDDIIDSIDYYIEKYKQKTPLFYNSLPDTKAKVEFIPHGVIGHIGVWNYPFWQTMISLIPALITGNTVVFKPSEYTTLTALKIADLVHSSGIPEDVFQVISGGPETGQQLIQQEIDAIVFTGSINTGRQIIKEAGIKPLILELSGNDPAIVLSDIDIEQTVRGIAYGAFSHSGEICIRIKRIYIQREIADSFIERLITLSKTIKPTPLIREEARQKVHSQVIEAQTKGAKILLGGKIPDGPGFYYPPTILLSKNNIKEEIFGPVVSITVIDSIEQAINLANNTPYGLGASIWTKDLHKASKIAKKIEAGNIWINDSNLPLPGGEFFQGHKHSSIPSSQDRLSMFLKKKDNNHKHLIKTPPLVVNLPENT